MRREGETIPTGWEVRRLKFAATCNDETLPESTDPDFEMAYVDISSVDLVNGITAVEVQTFEKAPSRARRIVRHGDTLISTVRTYLKAIAPVEAPPENMIVSTGFAVVRPLAFIDSGFLGYALQNTAFIDAVVANSTGVSYPAINPTSLICLPVCYPKDKKEQQQIAAFLDWKTGQIDALIAKKKELMDRLKEKRLAVITQAVTKGLNPNAPLRDSDISWVGSVPTHWELRKAKYSCEAIIDCKNRTPEYFDDGEFYVVRTTDVKNGRLELRGALRTDVENYNEWTLRGAPQKGDVLFTREAPAGEAALFDGTINICLGQRMMYFRVDQEKLDPRFLLSYFYSHSLQAYISSESGGSTVTHLRLGQVYNLPILQPPIDEQIAIAGYLDSETLRFDLMVNKVESAIARLTEYRTALITAATTGQIDVRHVMIPSQPASVDSIASTAYSERHEHHLNHPQP